MIAAGWSPSVRLFEAAACGSAMLSDRWSGIEEFFTPGREILLPESSAEVIDLLRTTHPDDRAAIGLAARERVLREHTSERRAEELESLLNVPVRV
jgi:spore maturation protein CgeB